jgi:hypothetical protein
LARDDVESVLGQYTVSQRTAVLETILARPCRGAPAISIGPSTTALLRGARRAARWTATLFVTALILLGTGAILLLPTVIAGR